MPIAQKLHDRRGKLPSRFDSEFRSEFTLKFGSTTYAGPIVVPPYWLHNVRGGDTEISLVIPNVVTPGASTGPVSLPGVSDFALRIDAARGRNRAVVTLPVTSVLPKADGSDPQQIPDALYDTLFTNFVALRQALDDLEGTTLLPGAGEVMGVRIAMNLAMRSDQVLRFRYILHQPTRWIDLWPGMRLVLQSSSFSLFDINYGTIPIQNNVFSGAGQLIVSRAQSGALRFSPFLNMFETVAPTSGTPWDAGAIGGYLDFATTALTQRFARMIYPEQVAPANPRTLTVPDETNSVTLVSADTYSGLVDATEAALKGQTQPPSTQRVFLTGRSAVGVEVAIEWMGSRIWVELGTTLADLITQETIAMRGEIFEALSRRVTKMGMSRWSQAAVNRQPKFSAETVLRPFSVKICTTIPDGWPASNGDPLDIPMLGGDAAGF